MMIEISKGQCYLRKYTRGIKQQVNAMIFRGVTVKPAEESEAKEALKDLDLPYLNMVESSELAIKLLIEKIVIDGKEYGYDDFDKLEQEDLMTSQDFTIIEKAINEMTSDSSSKKNS